MSRSSELRDELRKNVAALPTGYAGTGTGTGTASVTATLVSAPAAASAAYGMIPQYGMMSIPMPMPMPTPMPMPMPMSMTMPMSGQTAISMPPYGSVIQQGTLGIEPMSSSLPTTHGNDDDQIDDPKGRMPIHGNESNFNISSLLYQNILESDYFKALYQLRTYHEVVDEVYRRVSHVGPWQTGTSRLPSTAFCLLAKFMVMRLTYNQLRGLLNTNDCPFVRAMGFLYLRYTCDPKEIWKWFENYLEEEEEFTPSSDPELKMTMGAYCIKLLTDMQYFGTTLPRIPVPIERKVKVMLLLLTEKQKRRSNNLKEIGRFSKGAKVRAIYSDEENEPAWYDAVIDSLEGGKYWVSFPEYGNQSLVDLGEMDLGSNTRENDRQRHRSSSRDRHRSRDRSRSRDRYDSKRRHRSRSRSRDRHRRSRSRSHDVRRDNSSEDLLQKVLKEQRDSSAAVGKDYARRIAGYKQSLALKADTFTARRRSRSRSPRQGNRERDRDRGERDKDSDTRIRSGAIESSSSFTAQSSKSSEISQQQLEHLRKLKEKYGDASSSSAI